MICGAFILQLGGFSEVLCMLSQFVIQCSEGKITYTSAAGGGGNAVALAQSTGLPTGNLDTICAMFVFVNYLVPEIACRLLRSAVGKCTDGRGRGLKVWWGASEK